MQEWHAGRCKLVECCTTMEHTFGCISIPPDWHGPACIPCNFYVNVVYSALLGSMHVLVTHSVLTLGTCTILTVVTFHAGIHNGSSCNIKDIHLGRVPVIDLIKGELLWRFLVICLGIADLSNNLWQLLLMLYIYLPHLAPSFNSERTLTLTTPWSTSISTIRARPSFNSLELRGLHLTTTCRDEQVIRNRHQRPTKLRGNMMMESQFILG